jgi:dTDP-4-dehydrorhamnose reductase
VINCIGILNKNAEINKHEAVFLNSYLPHYLSSLTKNIETKVIQMSTDCVFSGKSGNYVENSFRDGVTFYDRSKALGELENNKDLTFRNSIIGPDMNKDGIGLFNWFMKQSGEIKGYAKAIWTGITTLTLAKAMEKATKDNLVGLYHLVNNVPITKYELLKLFNKYFKNDQLTINKSDDIILNKSLIDNRNDFYFIVPSYEDMIKDMKEWIINHKELYPHYFE